MKDSNFEDNLKKLGKASRATGLPLDNLLSIASEKNALAITHGISNNHKNYRLLDKDPANIGLKEGLKIFSCYGTGTSGIVLGSTCPYLASICWTDWSKNERKSIFYCENVKPFDQHEEYMTRRAFVPEPMAEYKGQRYGDGLPPLPITTKEKSLLERLCTSKDLDVKIPGIISDSERNFCDTSKDGFPYFCPLKRP